VKLKQFSPLLFFFTFWDDLFISHPFQKRLKYIYINTVGWAEWLKYIHIKAPSIKYTQSPCCNWVVSQSLLMCVWSLFFHPVWSADRDEEDTRWHHWWPALTGWYCLIQSLLHTFSCLRLTACRASPLRHEVLAQSHTLTSLSTNQQKIADIYDALTASTSHSNYIIKILNTFLVTVRVTASIHQPECSFPVLEDFSWIKGSSE